MPRSSESALEQLLDPVAIRLSSDMSGSEIASRCSTSSMLSLVETGTDAYRPKVQCPNGQVRQYQRRMRRQDHGSQDAAGSAKVPAMAGKRLRPVRIGRAHRRSHRPDHRAPSAGSAGSPVAVAKPAELWLPCCHDQLERRVAFRPRRNVLRPSRPPVLDGFARQRFRTGRRECLGRCRGRCRGLRPYDRGLWRG